MFLSWMSVAEEDMKERYKIYLVDNILWSSQILEVWEKVITDDFQAFATHNKKTATFAEVKQTKTINRRVRNAGGH